MTLARSLEEFMNVQTPSAVDFALLMQQLIGGIRQVRLACMVHAYMVVSARRDVHATANTSSMHSYAPSPPPPLSAAHTLDPSLHAH